MLRVLSVLLLGWAAVAQALDPSQVVVVCNEKSALSREATAAYCRARRIPDEQVVNLGSLPEKELITWEEYQRCIVAPLLHRAELGFWHFPSMRHKDGRRIYAIVLMPDVPLRISREPGEKEMSLANSGASVDSELSLVGFQYKRIGMLANPYCGKDLPLDRFEGEALSVCRIDGPDRACIMRMINDPLRVEKTGLRGWTVVDSGGPYREGDDWFARLAKTALSHHLPLYVDRERESLPKGYPLMQGVAFYFGWYAEFADGPFAEGQGDFRFVPGAVAYHLHSFSATSLHDKRRWVAALLRRGAAVTAGNVAEPFLGGNIRHDFFYDRLLKGYTVAEAALMAQPTLSWQWVVLGDPLYRPFPQGATQRAEGRDTWSLWLSLNERTRGDIAQLRRLIPREAKPSQAPLMAEMCGALCMEIGQEQVADAMFDFAALKYPELRNRLRCMHRRALALLALQRVDDARKLLAEAQLQARGTPWAEAMRICAQRVDKKTQKPKSSPKPAAGGASR